ncbi:MAG: AAA family ATPase [Ktedonobacteraceae bacterium]|nr:AAA family ATPase [Ktedonobacteraceae bacterium]
MESGRPNDRTIIPRRTLLVLCGPAGSGKSTFARWLVQSHNFPATTIVASDYCRAMVCDDENSQLVNRDAFDLFHYIIHKRMLQNCLTIADSTALMPEARQRLLGLARRHLYHTCLLILDVPLEQSIQQDSKRQRVVGREVIEFHAEQLRQALLSIPNEGWDEYHILHEPRFVVEINEETR